MQRRGSRAASPRSTSPALRWLCDLLGELARDGVLRSAHDVSDGGLAVALAEVALACGSGLRGDARPGRRRRGDALRRVLRARRRELRRGRDEAAWSKACDAAEVPLERIGSLGGASIALRCGELALDVAAGRRAGAAYEDTLPQAMAAG